jgi:hypothetical protein
MTQDEIMEMWDEVVKYAPSEVRITEFAKLVAAKEQKKWEDQTAVEIHEAVLEEREACAKTVEAEAHMFATIAAAKSLADGIRNRGEA